MLIFQIAKLKKEGREALVIDVANHVMDNHIFYFNEARNKYVTIYSYKQK